MFNGYEAVIGLEIHAQLKTKSKMFCSDPTRFDAGDNENTSEVSVGFPGALPVVNSVAIEYSIKTGLALNCKINQKSIFSRKNYFYPDLPKGYQISQYDQPLCEHGSLKIFIDGKEKIVSITRAHMEEDAGKSTHHGEHTLLNYNRSGIPLLEIVSGPDMSTPQEAAEYARTVRQILRYLDVCDGNLEEGSLRCDCNVSVKKTGETKLGTKVEIKNINSFRFVEKAIEYEIDRQIECKERGDKIVQETRLYDHDKNRTYSMRAKEDAQDYRYFPDPDLLPIIITTEAIEKIRKQLPEMPASKKTRFMSQYGLPEYDASVLTMEFHLSDYFERVARASGNPKVASNWIMTELMRELKENNIEIEQSPIVAEQLAELIKLIDGGEISGKIAKGIFAIMWKEKRTPAQIISEQGLGQISDIRTLEKLISEVLANNPQQVKDYKSGKTKLFGFFVGAVMKGSKGQANPDLVTKILNEKLEGIE